MSARRSSSLVVTYSARTSSDSVTSQESSNSNTSSNTNSSTANTSDMGRNSSSGSGAGAQQTLHRVPVSNTRPSKDYVNSSTRGNVTVVNHDGRWYDKDEPRSHEATSKDTYGSKSSKRHSKKSS